ncbi:MAG TPA: hypothetical protein DD434_00170 [Bacteroidales bacterium]|nr:hypothetical protein [Bacteroidales bacterium]
MAKNVISLLLLFLLPFGIFAQTKKIEFSYEPLKVISNDIYVDSVIDSRADKSLIGFASYDNLKGKINLKNGASEALSGFFRFNFPNSYGNLPVVVEIKDLYVTKTKTDYFDSIKTNLNLVIHYKVDDSIYAQYPYEVSSSINAINGFKDIEKEIRYCIEIAFKGFIVENIKLIYDYKSKFKDTQEDSPSKARDIVDPSISLNSEQKSHKTYSTAVGLVPSMGATSLGVSLSIYSFVNQKEDQKILLPMVVNIDYLMVTDYFIRQYGYSNAKFSYYKLGVNPLLRIYKKAYFSFTGQFVLGFDSMGGDTRLVVGLNLGQGFYYFPNKGFYCGFGIYEYASSSRVYPFDLGLKLEFGVKF